jgi:hypothetical protein
MLENFRARFGIGNQRRRPENAAHYIAPRAAAHPQKSGIGIHHPARGLLQQQHAGPQILKRPDEDIACSHGRPLPVFHNR